MSVRVATAAIAVAIGACAGEGAKGPVRINEVAAANKSGCPDAFGEYDDWIELFNASGAAIDLGGFRLYDGSTPRELATIPPGVTVPARGFLVFWADAQDQGLDHLPYKLDASHDVITLEDPEGETRDHVDYENAGVDHSLMRIPDGSGAFEDCAAPTCGLTNGDGCRAR